MAGLTVKQRTFIQEYIIDKNATRAAKRAGYSEKSAYSQGQRLLKNVEVAQEIELGLREQSEKLKITAERVLKRIAEFAFEERSQRASDTLKACELLGKHFKLFTERAEIVTQHGPRIILYSSDKNVEAISTTSPVNEHQSGIVVLIPDNGRSVDSPLKHLLGQYQLPGTQSMASVGPEQT